MASGMSLHVGLNRVSVNAFKAQVLNGCENDALAMRNIAISQGIKPEDAKLLRSEEATFANVVVEILRAAELLEAGDIFLFTFAGHGSRIPNTNEEKSVLGETDGKDEALVLFDRMMLDDYLRRVLWPKFKPGVRIVGVADSCHSGSSLFAISALDIDSTESLLVAAEDESIVVTNVVSAHSIERVARGNARRHRGDHYAAAGRLPPVPNPVSADEDEVVTVGPRFRALTDTLRQAHSRDYEPIYVELHIPSEAAAPPVQADLLTLAACEDGGETKDGPHNGAFTTALLEVWNNGAFSGSYVTFRDEIATKLPGQVPVLKPETPEPLPAFSGQKPFSI